MCGVAAVPPSPLCRRVCCQLPSLEVFLGLTRSLETNGVQWYGRSKADSKSRLWNSVYFSKCSFISAIVLLPGLWGMVSFCGCYMHLAGNMETRRNGIENGMEIGWGQGKTKLSFIITVLIYKYNNKSRSPHFRLLTASKYCGRCFLMCKRFLSSLSLTTNEIQARIRIKLWEKWITRRNLFCFDSSLSEFIFGLNLGSCGKTAPLLSLIACLRSEAGFL